MDGFEVFEKYHSRSVKELYVTIQRRGTLSLNRAAFRAIGSPEYAELLFNRSQRLIGIRPAKTPSGRTVPVRKQGQSESYLIAGLTFTKEYDIDSSVARRFVATMQGNMLIIDLNSPSTDATGPRLRSEDSEATQEELFSQSNQKPANQNASETTEQSHFPNEPETATTDKGINNANAIGNALLQQLDEEQRNIIIELLSKGTNRSKKQAK